jgi:hypothetical protein
VTLDTALTTSVAVIRNFLSKRASELLASDPGFFWVLCSRFWDGEDHTAFS